MHGEPPRALEPQRVTEAAVQGEERAAVAGRAVAEPRALGERPRPPRELAAGAEELAELLVVGRDPRE